jgi:hypothetical protein
VATARAATVDPGATTEITLLGIYTENLVALRGSAAAAETEFANLVAIANQAFLDGSIPVRLRVVGTHGISYPEANTNTQALTDLTRSDRPDTAAIAPLRDSLQADLVAMLRPHHVDDPTCGVAWLNGGYLNPDLAMDTYGFSVSSVGEPCGPLVLPHELGHNLGSHHDRRTANFWSQEYGAYTFSFGHRQDGPASFATIMAYPEHRPWVAQFSNPRTSACGDACGTARHSDNARSIALMAPRIARFRGEPPGTVTIDDVEVLEPNNGRPGGVRFVVQSSTPAPAGGIGFDLVQAGGSATSGVDYRFAPQRGLVIAEGTRYAHLYVALEVVGDDAIEGDETIGVRLENVTGASSPDPTATVTIIDDDPRVQLTGHVFFPPERRPLPDVPFEVCAEGGDGIPGRSDPSVCAEVDLADMSYRIGVVPGSTVTLLASPPTPFADVQLPLGDVGEDRRVDLVVPWGPVVSGRVVFPHGYPVPEEIIGFLYEDGKPHVLRMRAPEFRYGRAVATGAWVTLELQPEGPWVRYWGIVGHRLRQDATHDIRVGVEPTLILWTFPDQPEGVPGGTSTGEVVVELSEPAPFEGVRVDIAAVGGTATPGVDYRAEALTLEFAPGERAKRFPFEWFGDDVFEGGETIVFQASNVRGANLVTPTMTVLIEDHRPTGGNQRPERP